MNYELAKKLKDAGWPQDAKYTEAMNCDGYGDARKICKHEEINCVSCKERYYVPSFSELIEACGDKFGGLEKSKTNRWYVSTNPLTRLYAGGSPEEAVANLWCLLQKTETKNFDLMSLTCCSHCSLTTEWLAKARGVTIEEMQKERDLCPKCCSMSRRLLQKT